MFFHSRKILRNILRKNKPELDKRESKEIVGLPCECGSIYHGETSRPLDVRLREHMKNVKEGRTQISKLAEHVWDTQHKVKWEDADVVFKQRSGYKMKITEAAFIMCDIRSLCQTSKDMPNRW